MRTRAECVHYYIEKPFYRLLMLGIKTHQKVNTRHDLPYAYKDKRVVDRANQAIGPKGARRPTEDDLLAGYPLSDSR